MVKLTEVILQIYLADCKNKLGVAWINHDTINYDTIINHEEREEHEELQMEQSELTLK
jgi:hypothetical protein